MDEQAARDHHRRALVIDSHNDSTVGLIRRGNLGLGGESGSHRRSRAGAVAYLRQYLDARAPGMQLDIGLMRSGGLDAAFFAIDLGSDFDGGGDLLVNAAAYPDITVGLGARGRPQAEIESILGLNQLRLLEQVIG